MRERFRAYYRPTDKELVDIWADGFIILDTNTLLNFFRYTPSTRDEFLGVLEKLQNSLWLPHHVGVEFHEQRLDVISKTTEAFTRITNALEKAQNDISAILNEFKHHPSLSRTEISGEVGEFFEKLTKKLTSQQEQHYDRVIENGDAFQTFQRISDLYAQRIGPGFTDEELNSIYEEGRTRYERRQPPGFKDKDDSNPNQFGDLVIWREILRLGAEHEEPVIFVTDDMKEDWWWKHQGQTQGPRVELVDEYWASAGRRIHFYEPLRFLEYAKEQTNTKVSDESLEEVEEVSSANTRAQRILRERKRKLEAQRSRLLSRVEERRQGQLSPSQHRELHRELELLREQQRELKQRLSSLQDQSVLFDSQYLSRNAGVGSQEMFEKLLTERDEFEKHLASVNERRAYLEGILGNEQDHRPNTSRIWEQKINEVQRELHDVDLALDELEE